MSDGDASDGDREAGDAAESAVAPDDAFAALGDETRLRTVRELAAAEGPLGFTELFERVVDDPAKPSAGFAYHLRKLNGRYVDTDDEGRYRLTFAGRQAARALAAGVYTERVDRDPEGVDGDCPVCGAASLEARIADNHVAVACVACGTELLALPFPPSGVRGRDTDAVLDAFDAYHRARLRQLADGVCPDCAGRAAGRIAFVEPTALPGVPEGESRPVVAGACEECDFLVRVPVSVALADHPTVVAFLDDHGVDARDRPLWNLGPEWSEAVLSTDPPAVRVSVALGGEVLALLVGNGPTVVDAERTSDGTRERGDNGRNGGGDRDEVAGAAVGGSEDDRDDDQEATASGSS
ncbi:winged helix-turn-helix domain-containing protein [Halobaculum litoreum]|uniref:winged helix-turn-helix domain-containing protein n=1 Tax=Halobaculum litoreum TaxID=3031998 RepID=UPI0024C407E3|nr:winged helix-turn-helix domain-containing protein [Halobaculum sp. DT92]